MGDVGTALSAIVQPAEPAAVKSKWGNYSVQQFPTMKEAEDAAWKNWWADTSEDKGRIHVVHDTGSMPELAGSHALIRAAKEYQVGDVAVTPTWHQDNRIGAHLVTAVKPGYVYTKGINNQQGDGWTPIEQVIGKVERIYKGLK